MRSRKNVLVTLMVLICLAVGTTSATVNAKEKTVVAEAEVISGGDLLISSSVLRGAKISKKTYDFDHIFKYVKKYVQEADYAVINLETSITGPSKGYQGFPKFNTPENIIDSAKNAGFDMFLTASNHSYDHSYNGLIYKLDQLEAHNVDYIGTRRNVTDEYHKVVDVNGIKIGMLNYTKENAASTSKKVVLNVTASRKGIKGQKIVVGKKGIERIASYNNKYLSNFYKTLEQDISDLRSKGADIIVAYPHWGFEYNIKYSNIEDKIAQKMCDYGVDVIIGGHPHVVEPVKVYTSKVSGKTTVCLHSMGNFVSSMHAKQKKKNAKYTEDGVLFTYKVEKYADGTTAVVSVEALPTWVKEYSGEKFTVLPLDKSVDWKKAYGVPNSSKKVSSAYQSYVRTMSLVSKGVEEYNKMVKIYKQPSAMTVTSGKKAAFSVRALGEDLKYQWQYSNDGANWKKVTADNANQAKLTMVVTKEENGRYYRCMVSSPNGKSYSKKAKLKVK